MKIASLTKISLLSILIVSSLLLSESADAQDANLPGVYTNPTQSDAPIKAAIESGAAQFSFLTRAIARSRLKKINSNITRVEIARSSDDLTITLGKSSPSSARPGGPATKWTKDDETYDVSLAWQGSTLVQTFVAPDGIRVNRYSLSTDNQTLSLHVTFSSPMLKQPIAYTLTFKRVAAP